MAADSRLTRPLPICVAPSSSSPQPEAVSPCPAASASFTGQPGGPGTLCIKRVLPAHLPHTLCPAASCNHNTYGRLRRQPSPLHPSPWRPDAVRPCGYRVSTAPVLQGGVPEQRLNWLESAATCAVSTRSRALSSGPLAHCGNTCRSHGRQPGALCRSSRPRTGWRYRNRV
jgi:hypothetical protein